MGRKTERILKILSPLGIGISHFYNRQNINNNQKEINLIKIKIRVLYFINCVLILWQMIHSKVVLIV